MTGRTRWRGAGRLRLPAPLFPPAARGQQPVGGGPAALHSPRRKETAYLLSDEWTMKSEPLQTAILTGVAATGAKLIVAETLYMHGEVDRYQANATRQAVTAGNAR